MQAKSRVVRVSPAIAKNILDTKNKQNRNIQDDTVIKYAKDMADGRWQFTGDPIQFDKDGNMLNGQHRLMAVIKSGETIPFCFWEGLDPSAQDAMDAGRTRNTGQQLTMHGMKHGTTMAAVVRLLLKWEQNTLNSKGMPSTGEVIDFIKKHPDVVDMATHWADQVSRTVSIARSAVGSFAFRAFKLAEESPEFTTKETVIDFLEKLKTGAELEAGDPILLLRNTSARYRVQKIRRSAVRDLYNLIRTWNAVQSGESISRLTMPRDGAITEDNLILMHSLL
jgi:hypothetical protein